MLQVSHLRENSEDIIKLLAIRNLDAKLMIEDVLNFDEERRQLQTKLDSTKAEMNSISKEIGNLFKAGQAEKANERKAKTSELKEIIKFLEQELNEKAKALNTLLYKIPNVPNPIVPKGNSDEDNLETLRDGKMPNLNDSALPHWELAKKYDIIDFELGNKIAGAGFPVYKGKGARLQRALIAYFLDKNTDAGYSEYQLPHLVNEASGFGTGQLPDKEGQMYHVTEDNLYLIPTAEVPGTNIFRDVIVDESDLPIGITGYTPCFRREAGSYGAHVRGLNRLHQFDKVEIIRVEHPTKSYEALDNMVSHVQDILKELKLPYRILRLCGGDLTFASALTYDFEVFSAAQERWLEVSSVSNFETYQSNRLKLRFKNSDGKNELAHTLNGSSLALPRILASILENYQTENGIKIPDVLVPYTGFNIIN